MSYPCIDCGDPCRCELYMVHDHVWQSAGMAPKGGGLCISCLETRLGRQLHHLDFNDAPCNRPHTWQSSRLRARLGFNRPKFLGRQIEPAEPDPGTGWLRSKVKGTPWPRPEHEAPCGRAQCLVCANHTLASCLIRHEPMTAA